MMGALRRNLLKMLRRNGIDLRRASLHTDFTRRLACSLEARGVDLVFDAGANVGQYATGLLDAGFKGRIVSFEPLLQVREALLAAASRYGDRWQVAPRMALSESRDKAILHITKNLASSSLLEISSDLARIANEASEVGQIEVETRRLDEVVESLGLKFGRAFLKMDTQGSELTILRGATGVLPGIVGLQVEMSCVALYDKQVLDDEIRAFALKEGFELWDLNPEFRDPDTMRLLQYDAVFFRPQN